MARIMNLNSISDYVCEVFFKLTLREKCPNTGFFLVRIFLYSNWIQENTDQKNLRSWTLFVQCNLAKQNTLPSPLSFGLPYQVPKNMEVRATLLVFSYCSLNVSRTLKGHFRENCHFSPIPWNPIKNSR